MNFRVIKKSPILISTLSIIGIFCCHFGCNNPEINNVTVDSVDQHSATPEVYLDSVKLPNKIISSISNSNRSDELISVFNAEVNHIYTFPSNLTQVQTTKYDSTLYYNIDSSLTISKYVYKKFYDDIYQYPMTELEDIDQENIDTSMIQSKFIEIGENFIALRVNANKTENIIAEYREHREILIEYKYKNTNKQEKLMLCNVVGGTHAIVLVSVEYDQRHKEIVDLIMKETISK